MAGTLLALTSRATRQSVGSGGKRVINASVRNANGSKGIFDLIKNALVKKILPFITGVTDWTVQALVGLVWNTSQFIYNFDFNMTDEAINSTIKASFNQVAGLLGQGTGRTLGSLVCGALPTAVLFKFNPVMAISVMEKAKPQIIAAAMEVYVQIIQQSTRLLINATALYAYSAIRRGIRGSDKQLEAKLRKAGAKPEDIRKAIEARNKPWIMSQKVQDFIDAIKPEWLKNFVEQGLDEFSSSCLESGYIVAGAIDDYLYQQRVITDDVLVEISYDNRGEPIVKEVR